MGVGSDVGVGSGSLVAVGDGVSVGSGVLVGVFVGSDVGATIVSVGVCVGTVVAVVVAVGSGVLVGTRVDVGVGSGVRVCVGVLVGSGVGVSVGSGVGVSVGSGVGLTAGSTWTIGATVGEGTGDGSTGFGSALSHAPKETTKAKPTTITSNRVSCATDRRFMGARRAKRKAHDYNVKTLSAKALDRFTPNSGAESHPRILAIASPM